jgi:GT2 family glycosyltransferase
VTPNPLSPWKAWWSPERGPKVGARGLPNTSVALSTLGCMLYPEDAAGGESTVRQPQTTSGVDFSKGASTQTTVVIPAHSAHRWAGLLAAVRSAQNQDPPPAAVVVSVDHNPMLEERVRACLDGVVVVPNTLTRGASGTRNSGVSMARTPLVAFLDSDARAAPDWLENLVAPFADPSVMGTGGAVVPGWSSSPPAWFPEEFAWVVGASFAGQPTTQTRVRNVWSENMAVRRSSFLGVGGFSLQFGKVGDRSQPEDTDLCLRMRAAYPGHEWLYVPGAIVYHSVPDDRRNFRFFLGRCFSEGRGKVELARLNTGRSVLNEERRYMSRTLPRGLGRYALEAARHRDVRSLVRAGAMLAGVAAAAAGAATALAPMGRPR